MSRTLNADTTEPEVGEVWKASDGRRLRIVGTHSDGRVACRNVETNRLSYVQRRHFHGAREGNWFLHRDGLIPAAAPDAGAPQEEL